MNQGKKRGLALLLAGIMMFASAVGSMPVSAVAAQKTAEEEAKATLLFCSDFQTPEDVDAYENLSDVPEELTASLTNISKTVYDEGYTQIDSVLMAGDYSSFVEQWNYDADPTIAISAFEGILQNQWRNLDDILMIQGNHDSEAYPYDEGAHEYEDYIVYCINGTYHSAEMGGFPWNQGNAAEKEDFVKLAAMNLEAYFEECIQRGENRPVFIMVHLPLHFTGRTSSLYDYGAGDNMFASYLFEVINSAAEDMDIVYLFGHNHSKGWDSYMGGSRIFKQAGDTILIPDPTKRSGQVTDYYTEETLNFTYLNTGYIGYVKESESGTELTATVCKIYDDKLVFERYSEDGLIDISAEGKNNVRFDDSNLIGEEYLATKVKSPAAVEVDRIKEPGVKIRTEDLYVGELSVMHAVPKNTEAVSYEWSVSSTSRALLMEDGQDAVIFGKKDGKLEITVTMTDVAGNQYSATEKLEIIEKDSNLTARTEELLDGQKYMLVGASQSYTTVRPAVTSTVRAGASGDGVNILAAAALSGLNLNDAKNKVEAEKAYLWTVELGDNGTAALYSEVAEKYLHFEQGNKSVSLSDEPTYFEVMWSDYMSAYNASGKAAAFHLGSWYLNYSDSQSGFCCYDSNTYSQDGSHITNQYALYEVIPAKETLNATITVAEELDKDIYTKETWSKVNSTLTKAKNIAKDEDAVKKDITNAVANLLAAMSALEVRRVTEAFSDVPEGKWYVSGVQYVYENGLMSGNKGLFTPTSDITRAQIVTTLYRLAGSPEVTNTSATQVFSDVLKDKYYTDAVCWAYANGVATGNDGKFNPTGKLTRQQMAAFFFRYAEVMDMDTAVRGEISSMINADQVSGYAKEAVEWAVGTGLISGSEVTVNGNKVKDLNPKGNTSRAQVATILMRFCEE